MQVDQGRVLVVDDDRECRELLEEVLTPSGYEVTPAHDGEHALELIEPKRFDVILLDISMPGLDGFGVLRHVRHSYSRTELPIIMVSGRGERDLVVRALEAGANDYVTKPYDHLVVLARLRTQLSLKQAFDHILVLEENLKDQNRELAAANTALEKANVRMREDLQSAAAVQRALLPTNMPDTPGIKFSWAFEPCQDLAGDILNVFQLDDEHVGFYLLDVSSHGVRAALLSVTLSRILLPLPDQSSLVRRRQVDGSFQPTPPAEVAAELNRRFQLTLETYQYFTLFYGVLNTRTYELRYVSAGQPGPLYMPVDGEPIDLSKPVYAIGWLPDTEYREERLQLQPGDRVCLYSDGVNEAKNARKKYFGNERLIRAVDASRELDLAQSMAHVIGAARGYAGQPLQDDVSALAVEIAPDALGITDETGAADLAACAAD
ncbi:MAG: SpoIIE family protein phosphatase [Planctomycetota bacterium]